MRCYFRIGGGTISPGSFMALFFPAPFHLIRQGHLGHHLRNRSDDEAFDFYFEGDHKIWKFLVLYGILTGLYYVIVVLSNVVFLLLPFREDKKYWHVDQASTAFHQVAQSTVPVNDPVGMRSRHSPAREHCMGGRYSICLITSRCMRALA